MIKEKLPLFEKNYNCLTRKSKVIYRHIIRIVKCLSKVSGFKVNEPKSTVVPYTNNSKKSISDQKIYNDNKKVQDIWKISNKKQVIYGEKHKNHQMRHMNREMCSSHTYYAIHINIPCSHYDIEPAMS